MIQKTLILYLFCLSTLISSGTCADLADRRGVRGVSATESNRDLQAIFIGFKLINAETDTVINDLLDGSIINLGSIAPESLSVQVVVSGYKRSSVKITLSGATFIQKVERGIYALCGNSGLNFNPCKKMKLGSYNVLAELFSATNGTGTLVASSQLNFTLTVPNGPITPPQPVMSPSNPPLVMTPVVSPPVLAPVNPQPTKAPEAAPVKLPTTAPINAPTTAPVKAPTTAPVKAPTTAPVKAPTTAPVKAPTTAPVKAPTTAPVKAPTTAPVKAPTTAPIQAPVIAPISSPSSCAVPKLVGSWEEWEEYPLDVAESLGGMMGDDFLVVSGFDDEWTEVTKSVYAYNTKDPTAKWRKMDDVPVPGFTHAAFAIDGLTMYICGAYVGGTPGPDSKICLKYSHGAPTGTQWSFLPQLPDGRGGSGMTYIRESNSLVYSIGATRRSGETIDYATTWELNLGFQSAGWVQRPDCLYKGNHVSHVTAYYKGIPHYYWAGGQIEQEEESGNQNDLVEWDQATKNWIRRANMPLSRGHASSSTVPYGCGFLIIGGAINTGTKTTDISWYNIETDTWTKVGDLISKINTPVCDIVKNLNGSDWIYCQTGSVSGSYNWKSKITL